MTQKDDSHDTIACVFCCEKKERNKPETRLSLTTNTSWIPWFLLLFVPCKQTMLSSRLFSTSGHSLLVVRSFATIRPPSSPSEDAVSSPHPVSNLRLIRRSAREGETDEEADLRKRLDALQVSQVTTSSSCSPVYSIGQ